MMIPDWLAAAKADALERRLPELGPLLDGLATSTIALRNADEAQRRQDEARRSQPPQDRSR